MSSPGFLKVKDSDFASLVEVRVLLEAHAASLAAQRRTPDDVAMIQNALDAYSYKVESGSQAVVGEYLRLHSKIAEASKNAVLRSLLTIITPDIVNRFVKLDICKDGRYNQALEEHKLILKHIIDQEPELASQAMREHLKDGLEYSYTLKK